MQVLEQVENRRAGNRTRCGFSTWYSCGNGKIEKANLINISTTGARIVCQSGVAVGSPLKLLSLNSGIMREMGAVVRWKKDLPGALRSVVGLEILSVENRKAVNND